MATSDNVGSPSAHAQFILDVDILGRELTEDEGRQFAHALASASDAILEAVSKGDSSVKGSVLCGWRVWGANPSASLSSDHLRFRRLQVGRDSDEVDPRTRSLLSPVLVDTGCLVAGPGLRWHPHTRECSVCGGLHDQENDVCQRCASTRSPT